MNSTTATKRGIIFTGESVRSIQARTKTQTRRLSGLDQVNVDPAAWTVKQIGMHGFKPQFNVGDVLYVKETWQITTDSISDSPGYVYRATDPDWETMEGWKWKSPLFMPCAAARTFIEITAVRAERLQAISEADAIAEGMSQSTCAAIFDKAAGKHELDYCRWVENEVTGEGDPECNNYCRDCAEKVVKRLGKKWRVCGWDNAEESDGPAFCAKCFKPIMMSLSAYGIERELRIEEDPSGEEPQYFPVNGADARIVHMIADGIGDLQDEHLGRLAQIGFATAWNQINGKSHPWKSNPWVRVYTFKIAEAL